MCKRLIAHRAPPAVDLEVCRPEKATGGLDAVMQHGMPLAYLYPDIPSPGARRMWCVAGAHPALHAHEPPPAQQQARQMENSGKAPRLVVRTRPPLGVCPPYECAANGE